MYDHVICGGVFFLSIIAPLSFMIGVLRGIYRVSARSGHWLYLGTMLCVTVFLAWLMHNYFANPQILWITALVTGVAAAGVTEVFWRIFLFCCKNNVFLKYVVDTAIGKQIAPSNRVFKSISVFVGDLFIKPIA